MSGRVVFPVHDVADGKVRLIGYAGRALDDVAADADGKYKTAFHKSLVVYNLNRVLELETQTVIVMEGFFDTLKVHQAGFPNVVAVMGSEFSEPQKKLLVDNFDRIVIIGDGDASGRHFIADATERLSHNLVVRPIALSDGMQPDQMSSEEIRNLLAFLKEGR